MEVIARDESVSRLAPTVEERSEFAEIPLIQSRLKRTADILIASFAILLFLPVGLIVSLMIVLESRGPVFFSQSRMGLHGSRFRVLKFRSMYLDSESRLNALLERDPESHAHFEIYHKLPNDPRVTKVGRLLRRFSLDEVPQFWNIFRGDMSFVGPRPYLPSEQPRMNGYDRPILQARPGLTGLWQVSGRNQLSFQERLRMDESYIENWSISKDLRIALKTLRVVLVGEGAH